MASQKTSHVPRGCLLSAELNASGASQGRVPRDTDYKMREFAHIDPDGNLLLFGSPLSSDPSGEPAA